MQDRRIYKGLRVAKIAQGYLQFVDPEAEGEVWYMLSDELAWFAPVEFR
jgi:hypothetical protein